MSSFVSHAEDVLLGGALATIGGLRGGATPVVVGEDDVRGMAGAHGVVPARIQTLVLLVHLDGLLRDGGEVIDGGDVLLRVAALVHDGHRLVVRVSLRPRVLHALDLDVRRVLILRLHLLLLVLLVSDG